MTLFRPGRCSIAATIAASASSVCSIRIRRPPGSRENDGISMGGGPEDSADATVGASTSGSPAFMETFFRASSRAGRSLVKLTTGWTTWSIVKIPAKPAGPTLSPTRRLAARSASDFAAGPSCSNTSAATNGGSSLCAASPPAARVSWPRSLDGAAGAPPTAAKEVISCRFPSSKTVKSSAVSPATGCFCLSRTTTSTMTAVVEAVNLGSGGCCAETPAVARRTDIANSTAT